MCVCVCVCVYLEFRPEAIGVDVVEGRAVEVEHFDERVVVAVFVELRPGSDLRLMKALALEGPGGPPEGSKRVLEEKDGADNKEKLRQGVGARNMHLDTSDDPERAKSNSIFPPHGRALGAVRFCKSFEISKKDGKIRVATA